jgi:prepilin-type processing-associated H-X9-DG protein
MRLKTILTRKDIVVVLICLIFLVINVGAMSSGGRRRAKRILCLTNLKQLTLAWTEYAYDNEGKIVNGDPGEYGGSQIHLNEIPWVYKDWTWVWDPPLPLDVKLQAIKEGALWPYCKELKLYKCPTGSLGETRSYCVVDAMNCKGWDEYRVMLKTITDILNPSERAVFLDDGGNVGVSFAGWTQNSIYDTYRWIWWDPPPIRHEDGTTFSFADGHTEYWKWKDQRTVEWGEEMQSWSEPQPGNPDLTRSQIASWGD